MQEASSRLHAKESELRSAYTRLTDACAERSELRRLRVASQACAACPDCASWRQVCAEPHRLQDELASVRGELQDWTQVRC